MSGEEPCRHLYGHRVNKEGEVTCAECGSLLFLTSDSDPAEEGNTV